MTGYTPSISNQTTSLRSTLEEHSLSTYCTSIRGTCTRQNAVQSAFPRSVHVAEVVSLALVSNCLHLRLIVWTQSLKIVILVHIFQFLSRRTVIECISSLAYSNLISCSPAPTSRPSLPALSPPAMSILCALIWIPFHRFGLSRPHSLGVRLVGLILILVILCLISD